MAGPLDGVVPAVVHDHLEPAAVVAAAPRLVIIALGGSPGKAEEQGAQKFHQGGFAGFVVSDEKHQAGRKVLDPLIVVNSESVDVEAA